MDVGVELMNWSWLTTARCFYYGDICLFGEFEFAPFFAGDHAVIDGDRHSGSGQLKLRRKFRQGSGGCFGFLVVECDVHFNKGLGARV